jgi:hypothetical protein
VSSNGLSAATGRPAPTFADPNVAGSRLVNGKPYTPGPAPRLSVFVWTGAQWQPAAHANFNPLSG